ncbi:RNA-binding protein [Chryseobacterium sp. T16E-39]|uniref:RNA-binding S4 domain-containing protein n=1 Tax=Chryseobacterium sp. T16E-39 TaxID=2015076 RepID=UPI000B5B4894|nr:RNA-binding S4 domain-containing protein [Chryseobacterium sp. T16E-39]ASK32010.1 RNA-binding protein [Chryseobacterium sp. T16E-39]
MRIDKFLWSIRFYKTRTIATEEVKKNRVSIGDSVVKSSKEVKEGDVIKIRKNQVDYKIKVIQIPKSRMGAKLVPLHIKDVTDKEQYELLRLRKMTQDYYRNRGEGRPTKKDRRDMDGYVENDVASDFTDWDDFFGENSNEEDEGDEKS